jgi:hypothetical protein
MARDTRGGVSIIPEAVFRGAETQVPDERPISPPLRQQRTKASGEEYSQLKSPFQAQNRHNYSPRFLEYITACVCGYRPPVGRRQCFIWACEKVDPELSFSYSVGNREKLTANGAEEGSCRL